MNNKHWKKLKDKFSKFSEEYKLLKELCENQVVRWEWFKRGEGYSLEPFYFERLGMSQGRKLDQEPPNSKKCEWYCSQYGLNEQGRIIILRDSFDVSGQFYDEEFFLYKTNTLETIRYNSGLQGNKHPIRLIVRSYKDNRITGAEWIGSYSCSFFNYEYSEDKLVEIQCYKLIETRQSNLNETLFHEELFYCDDLSYDGDVLASIRRRLNDNSSVIVYQKPQKGQTVKSLCNFIQRSLIEMIPKIVENANISEQAYCLALVYADDLCLPPSLGVGLVTERTQWLEQYKETGDRAFIEVIWNPAEFTHYNTALLELKDVELIDAYQKLNQELLNKGSMTPAKRLLNKVAAELMKTDWQSMLTVTPDFVVYATDFEQADFLRNLKASIPKSKWSLLKNSDYL